MNAWNVSIATIRTFAKSLKLTLRPYLEMVWAFSFGKAKNGTKGENRLAIGTKQVQDTVSLPEMVQIFKSPSPAFQAFHHAKVERLRFTRRNRRENEHR
jgi:hypothetical protein